MRWSEVDIDGALWTLPAARAKNHREHLIPLSAPVLAILAERRTEQRAMRMDTDLVFTSGIRRADAPDRRLHPSLAGRGPRPDSTAAPSSPNPGRSMICAEPS
ncbi:MAG: hypothetical protein MZV65_22565 [Chromatiales bacterium]|nr:hypothetical protein [Chromatiales bacterium]